MKPYDFASIEEKWRRYWDENKIFLTPEEPKKKYYVLVMFAYPSGDIHMGHFRNYLLGDVVARYRMMKGYDVLHPFGWDAFGLPAEQAAISHNIHPRQWTMQNIQAGRETLKMLGISYDWQREVITCNPDYYKWTQWLFLLLFDRGLVYQAPSTVNWCQNCHTILANEQAQGGVCWRCYNEVSKVNIDKCHFFKYTLYAERLLKDLEKLDKWPQNIKDMQANWIGKSHGLIINFILEDGTRKLPVFTTRPDTIFGVTFISIAPEHELIPELVKGTQYEKQVLDYIQQALKASQIERTAIKPKSGSFTGRYAINPLSNEKVPIYVADYVLATYGTGIVMGVPAHDQRDFLFAKENNLPIKIVIQPRGRHLSPETMTAAYVEPGIMVDSGQFNNMSSEEAIEKISDFVEKNALGERQTYYHLKDWLISRQRYWGCPIPLIHCPNCGVVKADKLPVLLPDEVGNLLPKGRSPLEDQPSYVNTTCPRCNSPARRDPDTMDTFVCSSFYLFRYCDPHNKQSPWDIEKVKKWLPVDIYIGGAEHACMHLLYFRFITKVLYDAGWLPVDEPVVRLFNQGMVLDERGEVMSKSKGNVVSPREIIQQHGVDICRVAMLFFAPSDQDIKWSAAGIEGAKRFINRFWNFIQNLYELYKGTPQREIIQQHLSAHYIDIRAKLHQVIKRVNDAMEDDMCFNTAISSIMELINLVKVETALPGNDDERLVLREVAESLVMLLAPMAPFVCEELWEMLGYKPSIFKSNRWPEYNPEIAKPRLIEIPIQINGKLRSRIVVEPDISEEELKEIALKDERVIKFIGDKKITRVIFVPKKLINFIVS